MEKCHISKSKKGLCLPLRRPCLRLVMVQYLGKRKKKSSECQMWSCFFRVACSSVENTEGVRGRKKVWKLCFSRCEIFFVSFRYLKTQGATFQSNLNLTAVSFAFKRLLLEYLFTSIHTSIYMCDRLLHVIFVSYCKRRVTTLHLLQWNEAW